MGARQYREDDLAGAGWRKTVAERLAEDRNIASAEQDLNQQREIDDGRQPETCVTATQHRAVGKFSENSYLGRDAAPTTTRSRRTSVRLVIRISDVLLPTIPDVILP